MRLLSGLTFCLLLVGGAGCGDGNNPSKEAARPPERTRVAWDVKTTCPRSIAITEGKTCKLASGAKELRQCPAHPGGSSIRVSGIACRVGRKLVLPLGHQFSNYAEPSQALFQPSVVDPTSGKSSSTGWTCWTGFDPGTSIQYVCWRGSAVLTWRFS